MYSTQFINEFSAEEETGELLVGSSLKVNFFPVEADDAYLANSGRLGPARGPHKGLSPVHSCTIPTKVLNEHGVMNVNELAGVALDTEFGLSVNNIVGPQKVKFTAVKENRLSPFVSKYKMVPLDQRVK